MKKTTVLVPLLTVAALALPALGGTARAATPVALHGSYAVAGQAVDASTGAILAIRPTAVHATVVGQQIMHARLPVKPAPVSFEAFDLLPVTATVDLVQRGPLTGTLDVVGNHFTAAGAYDIHLTDVTVDGRPAQVGTSCVTRRPVQVAVTDRPGFTVFGGGTVAGTFAIGRFTGCGAVTPLIDALLPGRGNTISLQLSHFTLTPRPAARSSPRVQDHAVGDGAGREATRPRW